MKCNECEYYVEGEVYCDAFMDGLDCPTLPCEDDKMSDENKEIKEVLEGDDLQPVIIGIPKSTVSLDITANVIDNEDNSITGYSQKMALPEIIEARIDAEYWEDENVMYRVNPDYLEEINNEKCN